MHRPTFIFLLSHKTQPFNKKQPTGTINQIKQSEKTIPATTQSKTLSKQTTTNKPDKLSHQSIVISITRTTTSNNPQALNQKIFHDKQSAVINDHIYQPQNRSRKTNPQSFNQKTAQNNRDKLSTQPINQQYAQNKT